MTEIWGHRGASSEAPENTLLAFARAAKAGAAGIELDVHLLADGTPVVIHDETFERTTTGTGAVHEATLEQIAGWQALGDPPQPIPTLAEVLELLGPGDLTINIELKTDAVGQPGLAEACLRLVEERELAERVWWSSFNRYTLRELRSLSRQARIGLLTHGPVDWEWAQEFELQAIHPEHSLVTPVLVDRARHHRMRLHAWTVNDPGRVRQLAELGVEAIITDIPREAVQALAG
ncbi:glycerophosphodiester phosphodiesterase [Enemella sp. A6]|uniref:glycerophosphodiester phosphodiesterase n=1 Tax=Enemella sp. A6 TaxID=3440152 RepID=UPI003EC0BB7C